MHALLVLSTDNVNGLIMDASLLLTTRATHTTRGAAVGIACESSMCRQR